MYAKNTPVLKVTIGIKSPATALALLKLVKKLSTGIVRSANVDALLLIAAITLFIKRTTLRLALAFVLKTQITLAKKDGISIMLSANVSVRLKIVTLMNTGTPELVVASQNTALAQLVSTSTPKLETVNALNSPVQWVSTGTQNRAHASVNLMIRARQVSSSTHPHALAAAITKSHQKVNTLTWTPANSLTLTIVPPRSTDTPHTGQRI